MFASDMEDWGRVKPCVLVCDFNICVQHLLADELVEICILWSLLLYFQAILLQSEVLLKGGLDSFISKFWAKHSLKLAAECNVIQC